jgi:hypothetical protein
MYGLDSQAGCRDVYLAGLTVHRLLFGSPAPESDDEPPHWNPAIDPNKEFEEVHDWFSTALSDDPNSRFANVIDASAAFVAATATRPTREEVDRELTAFRGNITSQIRLFRSFPPIDDEVIDSERTSIWKTQQNGETLQVKLWRNALWGGSVAESRRKLAFLQKARDLQQDQPNGLPKVHEVMLLDDAVAVVSEWIEGRTLDDLLNSEELRDNGIALPIAEAVLQRVTSLHDQNLFHGDLQPKNVVVSVDRLNVTFIDYLDTSFENEGDPLNPKYSSAGSGKAERDREGALLMAAQILEQCDIDQPWRAKLGKGIEQCRTGKPPLATLEPALEVFDALGAEEDIVEKVIFSIPIRYGDTGPLTADEGSFFVSTERKADCFFVRMRGADESVDIRLNLDSSVAGSNRRALTQKDIQLRSRFESPLPNGLSLETTIGEPQESYDLQQKLLAFPAVAKVLSQDFSSEWEDNENTDQTEEGLENAADCLAQELAEHRTEQIDCRSTINVRKLWSSLVEIEGDLVVEAVSLSSGGGTNVPGVVKVPIEMTSGEMDFDRNDTVEVLRENKNGGVQRIGTLVPELSNGQAIYFRPDNQQSKSFVEEGQKLQFNSFFSAESLRRRSEAVQRVLNGQVRSRAIFEALDPMGRFEPLSEPIDPADLDLYGLNDDQRTAFEKVVASRTLGLVQGPPGTGKTRFIAALAHYALDKGLVRNVLLTSQANEAVNNAAEQVLRLFEQSGRKADLLRVGNNGTASVISEALRPYHSPVVEQALKDRFDNEFDNRIAIAAEVLGLPLEIAKGVALIEGTIRDICSTLEHKGRNASSEDGPVETLLAQVSRLGIELELPDSTHGWSDYPDQIGALFREHHGWRGFSEDRVERLLQLARLGRDFSSSVASHGRSFEPFLSGTREIVAGTCVGLGREALKITSTPFDLVIVDEAARCTSSELFVPLQTARWAVLVGDQAQLHPHHEADVIRTVSRLLTVPETEVMKSDFERAFEMPEATVVGHRLSSQYRMLPTISELVSQTFYTDRGLTAERGVPDIPTSALEALPAKEVTWYATDGLGARAHHRRRSQHSSLENEEEAAIITRIIVNWTSDENFVDWLETQEEHSAGVGVICMYSAQRDLVRRRLLSSTAAPFIDRHIRIGTVDSYQGKENPIVLVSLVRNDAELGVEHSEGFLAIPNRINVAVSRARDRLVIVGAKGNWPLGGPMRSLSDAFDSLKFEGRTTLIGHSDRKARVEPE